ncbi:MAG: EthD domain-containing protein [Pseudomonadota bacterium]
MIKLVYCITRKAGMSREAFYQTWLVDHAPLVKSYAEAIGASRYVQSHTGMDELNAAFVESRGLEPPYDGITEVWWPNRQALDAGLTTPEGIEAGAALQADEARFIDFSKSRVFMTEEHEIF